MKNPPFTAVRQLQVQLDKRNLLAKQFKYNTYKLPNSVKYSTISNETTDKWQRIKPPKNIYVLGKIITNHIEIDRGYLF